MKPFTDTLRALVLSALLAVLPAGFISAADFAIGAVGSVTVSPYKSYDVQALPLPFIKYESDRFFMRGTNLGVHLYKDEVHEISLGASYFGLQFRPSRTDDARLKHLDKRLATLMADASYSVKSPIGLFRAGLSRDVLGHGDGFLGNLSWHVPWITDCFVVMPGVGVEWASAKHNDYYYGVRRREAARSGLGRYSPGRTFSPYLTLEAKATLSERLEFVAKGRIEYLNGRLRHSPMVGKNVLATIMAGIQYNF